MLEIPMLTKDNALLPLLLLIMRDSLLSSSTCVSENWWERRTFIAIFHLLLLLPILFACLLKHILYYQSKHMAEVLSLVSSWQEMGMIVSRCRSIYGLF